MTIPELKKRSNDFVAKLDAHIATVVKGNSERIVSLNRTQMENGLTSKDVGIYPGYRNKYYAFMKKNMGSKAPMGVPDLKLTGSFHKGMKLNITGAEYEISSTDKKSPLLEEKYPDIFGLAENSILEAQRINGEGLAERFKQTVLQ
jgi:hypothetical protein